MDNNQFPQYLSAPMQFMWFDSDTAFLVVVFLMIGIIFGGWSLSLCIVVPYLYAKVKKKYSSSFLIHLFYFTGFKKMSYYPTFFENEFQE